ncbi:hypothetical protein FNV43_RR22670 [Rhamnella rubrinervis]|uniref:Uncharacterized protein n=1 Tax=Rhamnella rubrinervis TaxID=2594499 RepID=A0A8K0GVE1_9ROSA|nr:hypothetical protein FNV43_RR22670 [Rhamnella rubrinervis]
METEAKKYATTNFEPKRRCWKTHLLRLQRRCVSIYAAPRAAENQSWRRNLQFGFRPVSQARGLLSPIRYSKTTTEVAKKYIIQSQNATVSIKFQFTVIGTKPAPQVAFSSRGPDRQSPWILKPDILAPELTF